MLTGVRLAIGTAWLVIVAAEMLTGGVGIGFWVWDEWNNLNVPHIIIAIVIIGVVGLLLEQALVAPWPNRSRTKKRGTDMKNKNSSKCSTPRWCSRPARAASMRSPRST
jgi:ABC-type nitrate/sulfonate/bicarbonate transport system permease component